MTNPWTIYFNPRNTSARLRLFCFTYVGGSAVVFKNWQEKITADIELCAFQLPGRGSRMREKPFSDMPTLIDSLATALYPLMHEKPTVFYGHSMGALVSFELARKLRQEHNFLPKHLVVSGRRAADVPTHKAPVHKLPKDEFLQELQRLNGTPKEILDNKELMELLIPPIRADFAVCETYEYTEQAPLACPITVFGGLQDPETNQQSLEAWQKHTTANYKLEMFYGDHFFIHNNEDIFLAALSRTIEQII